MGRYFGTDGIRGKAEMFTNEFLERIVRGLEVQGKRILIGGDTRESTKCILDDLKTSLANNGAREVGVIEVFPTPGINYVMYSLVYDYAIDVTASHNPYFDNGIKIFEYTDAGGSKLNEAGRTRIEAVLEDSSPLELKDLSIETKIYNERQRGLEYYEEHLKSCLREGEDLSGLKLMLDCANGATGVLGKRVFVELGAEVSVINDDIKFGKKINDGAGSTHIEGLQAVVKEGSFSLGAAFDGDGDRCLLVDEAGEVVDGDQILVILARYLKLDKIVATVMANQGLLNWGKTKGVEVVMTDVGDQNVAKEMKERDIQLGGEQSGHIILPGEAMGDGLLTALMVTRVMKESGKKLSELSAEMEKMPQVLLNLPVTDEEKATFSNSEPVKKLIDAFSKRLEEVHGRVLARPSGTEKIIRITMWGDNQKKINVLASELAGQLKEAIENGNN
ncbi:phosphoglucosamine mutase [Candidatus Saccharibacteria bacterium]|nr:phosphoglucosamine mutase [Candidatus Saccharibacteria bacterium]